MAKRKQKLVKTSSGRVVDTSYSDSGQMAAFGTPLDDVGPPPSERTLTPSMNRHLDKDPLAAPQRFQMSLSKGAFN